MQYCAKVLCTLYYIHLVPLYYSDGVISHTLALVLKTDTY